MAKYDFASGASGVISGASAGSVFGPVGSAVGGLIGGVSSLFGSKKKKKKKISTMDKRQEQLYGQYHDAINGKGPLAGLYNFNAEQANQNFDQNVSRYANRNFQENIVPTITGQFRGNNLMNSSYAGEALGRAGRDVQESLDAQRSNYVFNQQNLVDSRKQSAIDNLMNTQSFAYNRPQQSSNPIDNILSTFGAPAAEYVSKYAKEKGWFGGGSNELAGSGSSYNGSSYSSSDGGSSFSIGGR